MHMLGFILMKEFDRSDFVFTSRAVLRPCSHFFQNQPKNEERIIFLFSLLV